MPVDKKVKAALKLENLKLPPKPHVLAIDVEDYADWEGDAALLIWVIIDENTTDEQLLNGKATMQIDRAIHDSLLKKGITLFPYTRFRKPSNRFAHNGEE